MSILKLVLFPDPRLQQKCDAVRVFDENLKNEIANMFDSMYHYKGIGLAACQVGIMKQIFIMDITSNENEKSMVDKKYCFINPQIVKYSDQKSKYEEGCLSFPLQNAVIHRPESVLIKFQDENGTWHEKEAYGLAATCIQHEFDHLNGITMPDRVNSIMKKSNMIEKAKKIKKERENT
ncbi:peptide deformylase [Candidatus Deianiraea vastatrix]|uniref:Peptide deformylase n=1 Tax=Candidatus Deianiraea vastatrix TaxID=2163644 RepID=A0A5B8XFU8_9RICK|nr:peptide deformylase [Candidatus Deianiraea vastatrix]QED23799.1 Peptide deformylase [Candidatus Deianiraea vastatrix]